MILFLTAANQCSESLRKQRRLAQWGPKFMFVCYDWWILIHFVSFSISSQLVVTVIMIDSRSTSKLLVGFWSSDSERYWKVLLNESLVCFCIDSFWELLFRQKSTLLLDLSRYLRDKTEAYAVNTDVFLAVTSLHWVSRKKFRV